MSVSNGDGMNAMNTDIGSGTMNSLIKYEQARIALAECRDVDDLKDWRDKSEALRLYAKQANNTEMEQWAAEIKLRAQRRIGEISASLETQQGKTQLLPTGGKKFKADALAEAGISTSTANRYEQLAAIPETVVEAYIAESKQTSKPVSAKAVLAKSKPKAPDAPAVSDTEIATDSTPTAPTPMTPEEALIASLRSEVARLQEEILAVTDTFHDITEMNRTLELSADPDVVKKVAEMRSFVKIVESQRDDYMNENAQLKEVVARLKRQLGAHRG